jgi:hypothetical protein
MKCEQVAELLSFEDTRARVDSILLAEHLANCQACTREYPEVAWLIDGAPPSSFEQGETLPEVKLVATRRTNHILIAAAAALFAIGTAIGVQDSPSSPIQIENVQPLAVLLQNEVVQPTETHESPASELTASKNTQTTWHKGRRITSTVERSTWRASYPSTSSGNQQ